MKTKKSLKSNLEKKRNLFFEIGLTLVLAVLLLAFETGNTFNEAESFVDITGDFIESDFAPVTRPKTEIPKPPVIPVTIEIVEDAALILDEPTDIWNVETSLFENMPTYDFGDDEEAAPDEPFVIVQDMPEYRGGDKSLFQQHVQSIVKYPAQAAELGIQGKVFVAFTVDKTGKLINPHILRSPDKLLSDAVLKALTKTDIWKPGEQRKRKVPVQFTIPIFFKLQ